MFLIRRRYTCFYNCLGISGGWARRLLNEATHSALHKREFSSKNFYDILNIPRRSSKNEIKQAYRKLALKYHPDRNPNNRKESEKKFREITEAYETLSDESKRQMYDNQLNGGGFSSNNFDNNFSNMSSNNNMKYTYQTRRMSDEEIEKIFKNVFGNMNLNDIFKSNVFNQGSFQTRESGNDFFTNFGSTETNIKTEIIPRGNKIIEKTTKIITYQDGVVKQEIIEREISSNGKGS
ncbi:DnaJ domain containing protein [Plasmodium gonderi]|uniref:DnaJ domain containing protein n=1 Tax=Plasmodium gonderi TaxID=77519 RepID=A0A1Y1JN45_PLAGO|nr:DnaJ domain containing protein [Plasmodium gonderi]GAW82262.1 DnaJ domain containing protein [Plasmodium gonderi]